MHKTRCQRFIQQYLFALLMSDNLLQGKHKLGQQHSDQDQVGVFKVLNASLHTSKKELASCMNNWKIAN
jgi:predicted FMN-binding regulatory protein PaiB